MAPVIRALHATNWARCVVIATAQHRGLLDQMLSRLGIKVDHDLDVMTRAQSPNQLLARMLPMLEELLVQEHGKIVLAQGDTVSVLAAALAAFHQRIPFGHVEAGLRTRDLNQPFPEEGYRQMIARLARWHFAPTRLAAQNLYAEGISSEWVQVTGNTGIDTLMETVRLLGPLPKSERRTILITAHRRENFGGPLHQIFQAVLLLAERYPDIDFIYPVHPNPNVQELAYQLLSGRINIHLLPPQDYFDFVNIMRKATLILTDSGGIQEEAPALGKPVLVLRDQTERPEAIDAGAALLVGTNASVIEQSVTNLLENSKAYCMMADGASPYGDGNAAGRIVKTLAESMPKS